MNAFDHDAHDEANRLITAYLSDDLDLIADLIADLSDAQLTCGSLVVLAGLFLMRYVEEATGDTAGAIDVWRSYLTEEARHV